MLPFAPIAAFVNWWTTTREYELLHRLRPSTLGLATLDVAESEIGNGEFGGNNAGPDVVRYRGDLGGKGSWCAALVFHCILVATMARGKRLPFERTHGARKLFKRAVAAGMRVGLKHIQPGDLVLWARGPQGSWKAHIGIVSEVKRDRRGDVTGFRHIAGNEGKYPSKVKESRESINRKRRIGFARLP